MTFFASSVEINLFQLPPPYLNIPYLTVKYRGMFLRVSPDFGEPVRDLLSNMFPFQNYELFGRALGGTKTSTNIVGYLFSFCALFVLY